MEVFSIGRATMYRVLERAAASASTTPKQSQTHRL
jgi:hypothetical protein